MTRNDWIGRDDPLRLAVPPVRHSGHGHRPWFWLAALVTGWQPESRDHLDLLVIWIVCFFVSILVHEMGHAFTALACGWPPQVYLYGFGGLAVYRPTSGHTTGRSVLISFAGPGAGFLLYGLILAAAAALVASEWPRTLDRSWQLRLLVFFDDMEFINLWWGLVNLLPVLPLDGGRIWERSPVAFDRGTALAWPPC